MTMDKANSLCNHLLIDYFMDNLNIYSLKGAGVFSLATMNVSAGSYLHRRTEEK